MKIAELGHGKYALEKGWWIFKKRMCFSGYYIGQWISSGGYTKQYNNNCIGTLKDCEGHFVFGYITPKRIQKLEKLKGEFKQELQLLQETEVLRQKILDYKKNKRLGNS